MVRKNYFLFLSFILVFFLSFNFINATVSFATPINGTNYSSAIEIKVYFENETDITDPVVENTTVYYTTSTAWTLVTYSSFTQNGSQMNCTIAINAIPDSMSVRFNITLGNSSTILSGIVSGVIGVDDTAPTVVIHHPINGTSLSTGIYSLNVTINDTGIGTLSNLFFNITNLAGNVQNATFNIEREGSSIYYSNSTGFNVSKYTEGRYAVRVYVNDTLGNINNSEFSTIYVDRTAPSTVVLTSVSTGRTTIDFNINVTDALSGITSACIVNRSGTIITPTGTGSDQNVSDSGLTCNTAYTYNVSCSDDEGNTNSSTYYSMTTSACEVASSSGSSAGTVATATEISSGYTKTYYPGSYTAFKVGTVTHNFFLLSLVGGKNATIQVSSTPQKAVLNVGEEKKFDVDQDGKYYDLYVKLNSITGVTSASVTLKSINESIIPVSVPVTPTTPTIAEKVTETVKDTIEKGKALGIAIWIVSVIIVIVIAIGIIYLIRNKKHKRYYLFEY